MSTINVDFTTPTIQADFGATSIDVDITGGQFQVTNNNTVLPFTVVATDGTGDYNGTDHVPIQAAIDNLASTGGTIFIKKGTYTLGATITMNSNIILRGEGWTTILKLGAAENTDCIQASGKSNILITDLQVDGTMASNTDGNGINIIGSSSFVTVQNCYIHDVRKTLLRGGTNSSNLTFQNNYCISSTDNDVITLSKTTNSKVVGNIVSTSGITSDNGIACYDEDATIETYNNQILGNYVTGCVNGIGSEGGVKTVIADNIVYNCTGHGITIIDGGLVPDPQYIVVKGNIVDTVGSMGINVDTDYFILDGNILTNITGQGIDINSALTANFIISNNVIEDTTENGINISAAATNFVITGNIIKTTAATKEGISIAGCTDGVVSNNQIQSAGGHAIQFSSGGCQRISIIGNQINASTERGITVNGAGKYMTISENVIYDSGQEGIYLGNTSSVCSYITVGNNTITNAGFGSGGTTYSAIRLIGATRCSVNGNVCTDDQATKTQNYGILEDTSGDYNIICLNMVEGNSSGGLSVVGVNSILANNMTS